MNRDLSDSGPKAAFESSRTPVGGLGPMPEPPDEVDPLGAGSILAEPAPPRAVCAPLTGTDLAADAFEQLCERIEKLSDKVEQLEFAVLDVSSNDEEGEPPHPVDAVTAAIEALARRLDELAGNASAAEDRRDALLASLVNRFETVERLDGAVAGLQDRCEDLGASVLAGQQEFHDIRRADLAEFRKHIAAGMLSWHERSDVWERRMDDLPSAKALAVVATSLTEGFDALYRQQQELRDEIGQELAKRLMQRTAAEEAILSEMRDAWDGIGARLDNMRDATDGADLTPLTAALSEQSDKLESLAAQLSGDRASFGDLLQERLDSVSVDRSGQQIAALRTEISAALTRLADANGTLATLVADNRATGPQTQNEFLNDLRFVLADLLPAEPQRGVA